MTPAPPAAPPAATYRERVEALAMFRFFNAEYSAAILRSDAADIAAEADAEVARLRGERDEARDRADAMARIADDRLHRAISAENRAEAAEAERDAAQATNGLWARDLNAARVLEGAAQARAEAAEAERDEYRRAAVAAGESAAHWTEEAANYLGRAEAAEAECVRLLAENARLAQQAARERDAAKAAEAEAARLREAMLTPQAGVATGGIVGLLAPQPAVDAADAALVALVAGGRRRPVTAHDAPTVTPLDVLAMALQDDTYSTMYECHLAIIAARELIEAALAWDDSMKLAYEVHDLQAACAAYRNWRPVDADAAEAGGGTGTEG